MKPLWDSNLVRICLRNRWLSTLWRPFSPLYNACLRRLIYRNGIKRSIGGGHDIRVCFENRRLQPSVQYTKEIPWLLKAIKPGMVVLDIGANIGLLSIVIGRAVQSHGKVFAFEPSPFPARCLSQNIALNLLSDTVVPVAIALGKETGMHEFFLNEDECDTQHSLTGAPGVKGQSIPVNITTVDEFCREHNIIPDIIKIDVEGFEPLVLEGARQTISTAKNLTLFIELHPWVWPKIGYDPERIFTILSELNLSQTSSLDETHVCVCKQTA